jgi:hypothetical protein
MGDYYKIHISSANSVRGSAVDGWYQINIPITHFTNDLDWQICVESFSCEGTFNGEPFLVVSNISVDGMWSTLNGGGNMNILLAADSNSFFRFVDANSIGLRISNPIQFFNSQIEIKLLDSFTGNLLNPSIFNSYGWAMVLVVYSRPKKQQQQK